MTLLQLTPRMPWPLTDGGAIGIFNITKSLAELGHEITLVTYPLDDADETREAVAAISKYATVEMVSKPLPARWKVLAQTIFRGAYPIERRMMPEMFVLLKKIIEKPLAQQGEGLGVRPFDIVHVDHAHMGKYGLWIKERYGLPLVLREHNFESLIYERFAQTEPNPAKRWVARVHGKRLKREEIRFLKEFDAIAAITEEDAAIIRNFVPTANVKIIPAGVDTVYFQPRNTAEDSDQILWIGSLAWDPNYDAVRYFLTSIFPAILEHRPSAKFDIIGSETQRVHKFAAKFGNSVRILGRVPDVRDFLAISAVLVVPLRIGGGMRLKLLDFFASGKAVVATSIAAEGNVARNGEELVLQDKGDAFASSVVDLMNNPALRNRLGSAARTLAECEYAWPAVGRKFEEFYRECLARTAAIPVRQGNETV